MERDNTKYSACVLVGSFISLLVVNSWHHALWSDELHAWGLTLNSASVNELFHNLHYEGHPGLWHLLLWIPSRLSASPDGMQLVALVVGSAIVLLIGIASPFRFLERLLLLMNYFVVFEYTVMARNYGIGLLLAILYAMTRRRWPYPDRGSALLSGLLLGLMANSNVYALFLSGFLALEYAHSSVFRAGRLALPQVTRILPGALLYTALLGFAVWTIWPPEDMGHLGLEPSRLEPGWRFAYTALRTLAAPFIPIDFGFPHSFAFPGNWFEGGKRAALATILLPFILAAIWTVAKHHKPLALALAGTALAATVFPFLIYPAAIRHLGVMFIGFVVVFWLTRDSLPQRPWPVLALLCLGAAGGCIAEIGQWTHPFSVDSQAAEFLRNNNKNDKILVADAGMDLRTEAIAILLDRPFYSLDCLCEDRFVRFSDRRDASASMPELERLRLMARNLGPRPMILLTESILDAARLATYANQGLHLDQMAYFGGAERDQQVAIYTMETAPP